MSSNAIYPTTNHLWRARFVSSCGKTLIPKARNPKMQIQIKCGCGEEKCPEWAVVELQGVVESQQSVADRLRNLEIGRLCHTSQGNYTFTVGYHELLGTKMPLKKPLLVLRKRKVEEDGDSSKTELEVIGIIRHKILFKNRPKALISSRPQIKEKKAVV